MLRISLHYIVLPLSGNLNDYTVHLYIFCIFYRSLHFFYNYEGLNDLCCLIMREVSHYFWICYKLELKVGIFSLKTYTLDLLTYLCYLLVCHNTWGDSDTWDYSRKFTFKMSTLICSWTVTIIPKICSNSCFNLVLEKVENYGFILIIIIIIFSEEDWITYIITIKKGIPDIIYLFFTFIQSVVDLCKFVAIMMFR